MRRLVCYVIALAAVVASYGLVTEASSTTNGPAATCAAGSINYVTHTLAQQCLKTGWAASPSPSHMEGSASTRNSSNLNDSHPTKSSAQGQAASLGADVASHLPTNSTSSATMTSPSATESTRSGSIASTPTEPQGSAPTESESESPLDNAKFLSFEDWKSQNLGAAGQSPEALARAKERLHHDRQRPGQAALDALGDDDEINLDFAGFGETVRSASLLPKDGSSEQYLSHGGENLFSTPGPSGARSKDAGRTCKERFNYASFDCAANVLKTNPRCKSSSSVLVENKDSYMLNECVTDNKFLIVELCNDIQIDTVVLANFEFFSSMFRTFRISVSDRYPVKLDKWKVLGTYEARNTREIQAFLVENPLIWARYLRVEFLTQYGNEFYCPLSLLRVHGTTMMEDYRHSQDLAGGEVDSGDDETDLVAVTPAENDVDPANIIYPLDTKTQSLPQSDIAITTVTASASNSISVHSQEPTKKVSRAVPESACGPTSSLIDAFKSRIPATSTCSSVKSSTLAETNTTANVTIVTSPNAESTSVQIPSPLTAIASPSSSTSKESQTTTVFNATSLLPNQTASTPPLSQKSMNATSLSSAESVPSSVIPVSATSTPIVSSPVASSVTSSPSSIASSPAIANPQSSSSVTMIPQASQPPTQESFFKSVNKRLTALEANATLSLQYIESQSLLLRDAFAAVEKRQLSKTAHFLASLNSTVLAELANARSDFDQLWQRTIIELSGQREAATRERDILGDRIARLAEEVVGQKRLAAAQATLLLLCLGLVIFGRSPWLGSTSDSPNSSNGGGVDARFFQSLVQRGRGTIRGGDAWMRKARRWDSPRTSLPRGDGSTRPGTSGSPASKSDYEDDPRTPKPQHFDGTPPLRDAFRPSREQHSSINGFEMQRQDSMTDQDYHDSQETFMGASQAWLRPHASSRASSIRGTQSAPTTPRVLTPPPPKSADDHELHGGMSHAR